MFFVLGCINLFLFVLIARGRLSLFLSVSGCPVDFSLFQVDSVVVGGCSLQKSLFVLGLFLLLKVDAGCSGCIVVFKLH